MAKDSKQILEEVVTRVVKKTIKEELKPIKTLFYALLKEQVVKDDVEPQKEKPVEVKKEDSTISPNILSLLEQTTPFAPEGPAVIHGSQPIQQPISAIDASTMDFANKDYSSLMKKVEEKANNNYRP